MSELSNDVSMSVLPSRSNAETQSHQRNIELVLSAVAFSALMSELGNRSLDQLENDCRLLVKRTISAVLEIGKRLLIIKSRLAHGQWIDSVERIGIDAKHAAKFMRAAIRISNLGGLSVLVNAIDSQTKLFELMGLDDDDLKDLDGGATVRGVTVGSLPEMTVKMLRATLKENAPKKTVHKAPRLLLNDAQALPPEVTPILGGKPNAETGGDPQPLKAGDRIKSLYAGRDGSVVRTYADGSASVLWDDGEPQEAGLGHERMPRSLLEYVEAEAPDSNRPTSAGSNASSTSGLTAPVTYPAVYALLPGDFNGVPVSLISHDGKVWMIAEEVAAILGDSPEAVGEMEELISSAFDQNFPEGGYTKATLASTSLVMRLLDQRAIRYVCLTLETPAALGLSEWIGADHRPTGEPAAPVPIANAKPAPTLKQCFIEIEHSNLDIEKLLYLVEAQINGIRTTVENNDSPSAPKFLGSLVEIAEKLISPFVDLIEYQDSAMSALRNKLFKSADAGDVMPESVWLDLVKELSADHDGGFTNDHMCNLANIVDSMSRFGEHSPEVECAVRQVEALAGRNGAVLYDHLYEGEAPGSERVAFSWKPGMEPQQRRAAEMAH